MSEQRFCDTPHAEREITLAALRHAKDKTGFSAADGYEFVVHFAPDLANEVRDLPNVLLVGPGTSFAAVHSEMARVEVFRFIENDSLPARQWEMTVGDLRDHQ